MGLKLVHGSLPWKADHQRRLALYRFSPPNFAYGRAYLNQFGPNVWDLCDDIQRAVLGPPHAVRLERPLVPDKVIIIITRFQFSSYCFFSDFFL